ncbi:MAG: hypothetical protein V1789_03885 [PVC group bacterium]
MVGVIALPASGLAAQWSASRRPGAAAPASRGGTGVAVFAVTGEIVVRGDAAATERPFRDRPASAIYRPRGRKTRMPASASVPPPAETAPRTEEEARVAETVETVIVAPPPAIEPPVIAAEPEPAASAPAAPPPAPASASYGTVPPYFIRNDGQLDGAVRYYVKGPRGTVYLTDTEVVFDFLQKNPPDEEEEEKEGGGPVRPGDDREENRSFTRLVFRQQFRDPGPAARLEGARELPGKINYFIGSKENWRSNIPTLEEVFYRDLYPGIDVKCYFEGANLRQLYTVLPGADPSRLVFRYVGADDLEIKPEGDLIVLTPFGGFVTRAPKAYQEIDGGRVEREAGFRLLDGETVALEVGDYDKQYPLIIE